MILNYFNAQVLKLQSGDIMAVKGDGPAAWACRNLIEPPTDRFHFVLLWMQTEDNDRVILESQGEGTMLETIIDIGLHIITKKGAVGQAIAIGRLSMYYGMDVRFFRPVYIDKKTRRQAPCQLSCYGRASYGYDYITKLTVSALGAWIKILWKERRFRRLNVMEVPYIAEGKALICTLAPEVGYRIMNEIILPVGVTATPNAYEQAVKDGVLRELTLEDCLKEPAPTTVDPAGGTGNNTAAEDWEKQDVSAFGA